MYYIELKMKKKLIVSAGMVIVAAAALFALTSLKMSDSSILFSANVEALARSEGSSSHAVCYSQYLKSDNSRCLECMSCEFVDGVGVHRGGVCRD
mgnify:CR=1 FL=1